MDTIEELDSMLSRGGSFWSVTLSDEDRKIARTIAQTGCRTRVARQLQQAHNLLTGGGYYRDSFRVIRFKESDVNWVGTKAALQKRTGENLLRAENLNLGPGVWLEDGNERVGADEHKTPVLFPYADVSDVVFPGNFRVRYCLTVSPDVMVESILDESGRTLMQGTDFMAFFGSVWFSENPMKLFPQFRIRTQSVMCRARNLFSYTLRLDNVYGPVDRVLAYYKGHQSVHSYYLAAAQACGMAVTRQESVVENVSPLLAGCAYTMRDGSRYDAPYNHTWLSVGTTVPAGTVIGGQELFELIGPTEDVPEDVTQLHGDPWMPGEIETSTVDEVRETMFPGRCVVVRINEAQMPREMQLSLGEFLRREVPLGAVLTYSPITSTIPAGS